MERISISDHLGFGCVGLATYKSLNYSLKLLEQAYHSGINYFDTAPIYSKGYSEIILGKFLQKKRDKVLVSTKFGLGHVNSGLVPAAMAIYLNQQLRSKETERLTDSPPSKIDFRKIDKPDIEKCLMASLKRLKTDYLDCFLLHEGLSSFLTDEAFFYLQSIKTAGIVKKIGLATNYFNLKDDQQLKDWDILQYDHHTSSQNQDGFVSLYPNQTHIYHSTLKRIKKVAIPGAEAKEIAGIVLAGEIRKNPNGRILFATGNNTHLQQNLISTEKYLSTDLQTLNRLLNHAF
ncbi:MULTISPECIES: aldo/keto reductase [unclassified Pedobacter]|uniref:aldo/keto reductase n=1 Tax=unclassified Pedobacter TaxID=2628915 RepID=UPI00141F1220|nr:MULTISPECIES: aldo/keto reductase [unclassified Pedobacter]NII81325.1 aryl-alcohol dehydrogenase-like predicted oxidoreductase [Pedobacter sp. SG908]NMN35331.1 aryl-alcohol dehydrogenase-like predicted oxidoreductase [Pedobacter sp. SG918]